MRKICLKVYSIVLLLFLFSTMCACSYLSKKEIDELHSNDGVMMKISYIHSDGFDIISYKRDSRIITVYFSGLVVEEIIDYDCSNRIVIIDDENDTITETEIVHRNEFYLSESDFTNLYTRMNRIINAGSLDIDTSYYSSITYEKYYGVSTEVEYIFYDREGDIHRVYSGCIDECLGAEAYWEWFSNFIDEALDNAEEITSESFDSLEET